MHDPSHPPIEELPLNPLLEPISDAAPTGESLDTNSFSSPLYEIKQARDEAEKREAQYRNWQIEILVEEPLEKADWGQVISPAIELLTHTSKDLRAAAWLGEALIRVYGVPGVKEALSLCSGLATRYWDELHPRADQEEGHSTATSGLKKMFGDATVRALGNLTFVVAEPPPDEPPRFATFDQYRHGSDFDQITDEQLKEKRRARFGWVSTNEFLRVAEATPLEYLKRCREDLAESVELTYQFGSFLRENCRPDRYGESTAPDSELIQFRGELEWMLQAVEKQLAGRGDEAPAEAGAEGERAGESAEAANRINALAGTNLPNGHAGNGQQRPFTREDAFRAIEEIAIFFETNEPHSPIHFGLRQVVRWGRMSLPDLLRELLEDDQKMVSLGKRIGFQEEDTPES